MAACPCKACGSPCGAKHDECDKYRKWKFRRELAISAKRHEKGIDGAIRGINIKGHSRRKR